MTNNPEKEIADPVTAASQEKNHQPLSVDEVEDAEPATGEAPLPDPAASSKTATPSASSPRRRPFAPKKKKLQEDISSAWDLPPIVASPSTNKDASQQQSWKARSLRSQTPQHLSSIILVEEIITDGGDQASRTADSEQTTPRITRLNDDGDIPKDVEEKDLSKVKAAAEVEGTSGRRQSEQLIDVASTASSTCAPVLWKNRYLVMALQTGEIRVYDHLLGNAAKTHPTESPLPASQRRGHHNKYLAPPEPNVPTTIHRPVASVSLESDATLVQLLPMEEHDILLALSVEGNVHGIRWTTAASTTASEKGPKQWVELTHSWVTGEYGATCMTILESSTATREVEQKQDFLLVIGYNHGLVECWKLSIRVTDRTAAQASRRPRRTKPECSWRGQVQTNYGVYALTGLPATVKKVVDSVEKSSATDLNSQEDSSTATPNLLIAVLQARIGDDPPLVQAFDAIGISKYRQDVQSKASPHRDDLPLPPSQDEIVSLPLFRVPLDPAMGFVEIEPNKKNIAVESSNEDTDTLQKLYLPRVEISSACRTVSIPGSEASVCVALSNGTVARLSPGWGVKNDMDQLQFSYPVIGMGILEDYNDTMYLVCGCRAGTCYLVPLASKEQNQEENMIRVIEYPHDIDADHASIYVEHIITGNVKRDDGSTMAVLIYTMPGGVVEVYACELIFSKGIDAFISEEDEFLEALIRNGCLEMVLKVFEQTNDFDMMDTESRGLWENARAEISKRGEQSLERKPSETITDEPQTEGEPEGGTSTNKSSLPTADIRTPTLIDEKDIDLHELPALRSLLLSLGKL